MSMVVMKGLDLRKRMMKIFGTLCKGKTTPDEIVNVNAESITVRLDEYGRKLSSSSKQDSSRI